MKAATARISHSRLCRRKFSGRQARLITGEVHDGETRSPARETPRKRRQAVRDLEPARSARGGKNFLARDDRSRVELRDASDGAADRKIKKQKKRCACIARRSSRAQSRASPRPFSGGISL